VSTNSSLPATLTAIVDTIVTLTLTVSNPSSAPVKIEYSSGQHFDFTVSDATTGAALWVWSADKLFMQSLAEETIPANGKVEYSAQWTPSTPGNFMASGTLVSRSHRAAAELSLSVP
jgi:hypothetical protein